MLIQDFCQCEFHSPQSQAAFSLHLQRRKNCQWKHFNSGGIPPREFLRELQLVRFTPLSGNTCVLQLCFVDISEILLLFIKGKKAVMETQQLCPHSVPPHSLMLLFVHEP